MSDLPKKALISLDDFNASKRLAAIVEYPIPNGIECPKCGDEMGDSDPMILMSYPEQRRVSCKTCGHKGYRLA